MEMAIAAQLNKPSIGKLLFLETRPQFLTLIPCVLSLGVALKNHDGIEALIPALGWNVLTVLATPALMAIGLAPARLTG